MVRFLKVWQWALSLVGVFGVLLGSLLAGPVQSQALALAGIDQASAGEPLHPIVVSSLKNDYLPALRSLRERQLDPEESYDLPYLTLPKALAAGDSASPAFPLPVPSAPSFPTMPSPEQSFDGLANLFGGWPPDTQGDIGPNHYVQWINLHFAVWEIDRTNQTATQVYGPVTGKTLFQGFGGACESRNDGDPITLYDPFADRWFMSQFAFPNYPNGPFYQCVAVSQGSNPTGGWYRYQFQMPVNKMNDYPKFGVWPDAYYMTVNQFNGGLLGWGGAGVAALERSAMLTGSPARMVYLDLYSVNSNYGGMLPADFDGLILPPADAPGYFLEWDDKNWIPTQDALRLWEFHVDWDNPDASTFGVSGNPNQEIPTQEVDPNLCGTYPCIPQPDTGVKVAAISDRLMYRLQYRNFGGYETLVTNHTVDADSMDHAGVHWFELHKTDSSWFLFQEGVYAPDADHRWMGSSALDRAGNMALGYSVSGVSTYPSVRYTGRLVSDALGDLPQGEQSLVEGGGSQTGASRWGDYSMMGVDPVDDCTFWYTQEYIATTGSNSWKTRIGSFRFPSCLPGYQGTLQGMVTDNSTSLGINRARVQVRVSDNQTLSTLSTTDGSYALDLPIGIYSVTVSAYGYLPQILGSVEILSGTLTTRDFALAPAPFHTVSGTARDAATGWPLYASINIDGSPLAAVWSDPASGAYSVSLPEETAYTFRADAFVDGYSSVSINVGPLTGDLIQDILFHVDASVCQAPGYRIFSFDPLWARDFEADNGGFSVTGTSSWEWGVPTTGPGAAHSGSRVWATNLTDDYGDSENGYLTSPAIDLSAQAGQTFVLRWWQWLSSEQDFDFASLEVSKDGGSSWAKVYAPVSGLVNMAWAEHMAVLDSSYAVADFRMRFHFYSDVGTNAAGWYVDDVSLGVGGCWPYAGSLVVGNVYDANTLAGIHGAVVTNDSGRAVNSQATPLDPFTADGFYTLFSPQGTHVFTATQKGGYQPAVDSVGVPISDTLRHDLYLPAGWLQADPPRLEVVLQMGLSTSVPLTLSNLGGVAASFDLMELDKLVVPLGPLEPPLVGTKPFKQSYADASALKLADPPDAALLPGGQVLRSWELTSINAVWGVVFDAASDTVWVSSPAEAWNGADTLYEFQPEGISTGRSYVHEMLHNYGPADMAYNWNTGKMWIMNVNIGINCIYEIDPEQGYTGNSICPGGSGGFANSQRGLAYDPSTDTWFAGGWNDEMIYRFDSAGNILSSVNTGLSIAGLAYNPETQHLFVMISAATTRMYVLDVANNYAQVGQFAVSEGFGMYAGAGLEFDCNGHLWAADQAARVIAQFEAGETPQLCERDVPWLNEMPTNGTIASLAKQSIDVTFDAGVPQIDQPAQYRAQLKLYHDTPYIMAAIPVTMTVTAPADWGKLNGVVTSLGYCDANPSALQDAQVVITNSSGITWTLATDASGYYQRWVNQAGSPYQVTVTAPEHLTEQRNGVMVTGGITASENLDLHWLQPCVNSSMEAISITLKMGLSTTLPVMLSNAGYVDSHFEWIEAAQGYTPLAANAAAAAESAAEVYLSEGFESGVVPPPEWGRVIQNPSTWSLATTAAHTGNYYARVLADYDQNEWLLSPVLYLGQGTLSFWSYGSFAWCIDPWDKCDLNAWIVVGDPGGDDDIFVGKIDDDWVSSWIWSPSVYNLTPLLPGGPVRIGFQYVGDAGEKAGIDDILVQGVKMVDVPWLTESPITGTLPALGGSQLTEITLDSAVLDITRPGAYYASLWLDSADPVHGQSHTIPVTMTVLPPEADLQLTQSASADPVLVGSVVTYTLVVTNHGPTRANGVILVDVLPVGVRYLSNDSGCELVGRTVACDLDSLEFGEVRVVNIRVTPRLVMTLINQAAVFFEYDLDTSNNAALNYIEAIAHTFLPLIYTGGG